MFVFVEISVNEYIITDVHAYYGSTMTCTCVMESVLDSLFLC